MVNWETVEVPRGSFIGWGNTKGQHVTGRVLDYSPNGGSDYAGNPVPQVDIELTEQAASFNKAGDRMDHAAGELVTVTCSPDGLKKGVRRADPAVGDLLKIVMDGLEDIGGGKSVKRFTIQIARGAGKKTDLDSSTAKQIVIDRREKANTPVNAGFGTADGNDEPPF